MNHPPLGIDLSFLLPYFTVLHDHHPGISDDSQHYYSNAFWSSATDEEEKLTNPGRTLKLKSRQTKKTNKI